MAMDRERPRGRKRRKVCTFCVDKVEHIDYKDAAKLRRFLSERSKILPRRTTGTCAMHQRQLTEAIRSRCCPSSPTKKGMPPSRSWTSSGVFCCTKVRQYGGNRKTAFPGPAGWGAALCRRHSAVLYVSTGTAAPGMQAQVPGVSRTDARCRRARM